ncbi:hypothetical protein [Pseudalkalibacillus caeni]|uniref:Spore coat protein n=1 Tax=Exobacillus caeni TaxID=2574798 RepID=A0A5R9F8X9_9BACL|nr:hypothetical protein [Pseudalkalibacillus caeni]TLS38776.1 hypothetical protein FCL54_00200 [Pseudalkalibacillus caeni]
MQQQQPQNQQQQGVMQHPPKVLSTKDHLYLTDMMSWNLMAMKKAHFYADLCQDQDVKAALDKAGQMHQQHYQKILNHMEMHLQEKTQPSAGIQQGMQQNMPQQ